MSFLFYPGCLLQWTDVMICLCIKRAWSFFLSPLNLFSFSCQFFFFFFPNMSITKLIMCLMKNPCLSAFCFTISFHCMYFLSMHMISIRRGFLFSSSNSMMTRYQKQVFRLISSSRCYDSRIMTLLSARSEGVS